MPESVKTVNTFEVIAKEAELQEASEAFIQIGQLQAFGAIGSLGMALQVRTLKKLKDSKAYKRLGMDWERFCSEHVKLSRPTVDQMIRKLEEFGEVYYALADITRVSPTTFRALEGSITTDGEIEFGGDVVAIDKSNAPRIREIVAHFQDEVRKEKQRAADARHDAKEAREQRDEARKAEKREKERFEDEMRRQSGLYPHLTANQKELRAAQALVTSLCMKLRAVKNSDELTEAERSELKGCWGLFLDQICDATGIFLDPMQMELLEDAKTLLAQEA